MPDRTTIVMPLELKSRAMARARARGISFGELVRRAVEKEVATSSAVRSKKDRKGDPFWDNLQAYVDNGPKDLAARHDDYLYGSKR